MKSRGEIDLCGGEKWRSRWGELAFSLFKRDNPTIGDNDDDGDKESARINFSEEAGEMTE